MSQSWKWSLREALSIIRLTYLDDWGKGAKERAAFLENSSISAIEHSAVTGLQSGDGQQAVIFLHGSPAHAMRWADYLEQVPKGYHYISVDRMGFGNRKSDKPNLEKDFKTLSNFVAQFNKPILVAHSLGGALAVRLAAENDIGGMVLVASSLDPSLEKMMLVQKLGNWPIFSWILSQSIRHSNLEMAQLQAFMEDSELLLGEVTALTQIIHPKDDGLVPYAHVAYAKEKLINVSDMAIIDPDEGGHSIPWTHQELVQSAIEQVNSIKAEAA